METINDSPSMMKQALERRQVGSLPSNFSFRMMEQIHREVILRKKRTERILLVSLITVVVTLVGGVVGYLIYYMRTRAMSVTIPSLELPQFSTSMLGFYCYIAVLVFILLGFDYWLRRKKHLE